MLNPEKIVINSLYTWPPHLYTVATLPGEIQKVIFNSIIHTYFGFFIYIISEENKLLPPYPLHLKMSAHYLVKCTTFSSDWKYVAFLPTLVALKKAGCDVWQIKCQASNVTANVQSDHLLHGYMLPVFFATEQLHNPPRCAEIQPI